MKPCSPPGRRDAEKRKPARGWVVHAYSILFFSASACLCGPGFAAPSTPDSPGRLFFNPAQRAQLEAARARDATPPGPGQQTASAGAPAPLRYDGVVIRSDGQTTRWVDGKAQRGDAAVSGLKPGQIRADGRVYEPYQVLRPTLRNPAKSDIKETIP